VTVGYRFRRTKLGSGTELGVGTWLVKRRRCWQPRHLGSHQPRPRVA
jgi:hypothetical protein